MGTSAAGFKRRRWGPNDVEFRVVSHRRERLLLGLGQVVLASDFTFAGMGAFVAVINAASFTCAPRTGNLESAISRRTSDIDAVFGCKTPRRTANRASPTEVGTV